MNLRYDMITAVVDCGEVEHPQMVVRKLGISYQHATPQSIADQWWFWDCENVPEPLPKFLSELNVSTETRTAYTGRSK